MLDVSRIVSGKIRLDVQPVEMSSVLENAVLTLQPGVELHGGTVHADSAGPGPGSTFTVKLPVMVVQPLNPEVGPTSACRKSTASN